MGDLLHLSLLNRKQRLAWKKQNGGQPTMLINLKKEIVAYDADETQILDAEKKPPTVKTVVTRALRQVHADDQKDNLPLKQARYNLLKRIEKVDEIEMTDSERELCCNRVGKIYLQVELIGGAVDVLQGKDVEVAALPQVEAPKEAGASVSTEIPKQ